MLEVRKSGERGVAEHGWLSSRHSAGDALQHALTADRCAYVHVARGSLTVNGIELDAGDALKVAHEPMITVENATEAEILLFDLPVWE